MSAYQYKKFLLFGDSITEYAYDEHGELPNSMVTLGAMLGDVYTRKLEMVQRGFSSYTSREGVKMIRQILKYDHDTKPEAEGVAVAYVFFGTNDARVKSSQPGDCLHVDLDDYVSNVLEIVRQFQIRKIPVVVITPGFHNREMWLHAYPPDRDSDGYCSNELNLMYAEAVEKACDVPVLNLYRAMESYLKVHPGQGSKDLLIDGIHMSGTGYKIIYDELLKLIKEHYPRVHPDNIARKFPEFEQFDESTDFSKL